MHIIRTYSAGVHVGTLKSHDGTTVVLTDASRIWRWRGANTLHELALHGWVKVALDTLARMITRRTEPHVKLH